MSPSSPNKIKRHYVREKDGTCRKVAICPECQKVYADSGILEHIRQVHTHAHISCQEEGCPFTTKSRYKMAVHRARDHQFPLHKCPDCPFETVHTPGISRHRKNVHGHIPRKMMPKYHQLGPMVLEEGNMVPMYSSDPPILLGAAPALKARSIARSIKTANATSSARASTSGSSASSIASTPSAASPTVIFPPPVFAASDFNLVAMGANKPN